MPKYNPMDEAKRVAFSLTQAIMKLQHENRQQQGCHMESLQNLASIFKQATVNSDANDSPVVQTSFTPTSQKEIFDALRTHGREKRNNTPGLLPAPIR